MLRRPKVRSARFPRDGLMPVRTADIDSYPIRRRRPMGGSPGRMWGVLSIDSARRRGYNDRGTQSYTSNLDTRKDIRR